MKQRAVYILKTIAILSLAFLTLFQVYQLWLVNITNRNFFPYLSARFPPSAPDGQTAWAKPFRILVGNGDGRFTVKFSDTNHAAHWLFGERVLDSVISSGEFIGVYSTEHVLLSGPVIVYEYAFPMEAETFARALGHRNAALLVSQNVNAFTRIAIIPPQNEEVVTVFFMREGSAWGFSLQLGGRGHPAEDYTIEVMPDFDNGIHHAYMDGAFFPVFNEGFVYRYITATNPYQNAAGLLTLSSIRPRIELFFDNPATINPTASAGTYTFSNLNTMVRYLPFDVLEYMSYRTIGRVAPANHLTDFSAALAFIQRDVYVSNETFLAGYEERGREHVFWFNYIVDGFLMEMTEPWYTGPMCQDPLRFPIEVVVDHGRVVRYRRIAYSFFPGGESMMPPPEDGAGNVRLTFPLSIEPVIHLESALVEPGA